MHIPAFVQMLQALKATLMLHAALHASQDYLDVDWLDEAQETSLSVWAECLIPHLLSQFAPQGTSLHFV